MKRNKKRIVVALGGNALGNTPAQQLKQVRAAAGIIADLAAEGHELIIGHGNGPQVGIINSAMNYAAQCGPRTPYMPFAECGAMSQGFIGYHLQQALQQSLQRRGIGKTVVSVVTQVEVDPQDPAFLHPTKPIGNFYTREEAEEISAERGFTFVEDAGRGYRRVVPSPRPRRIVELGAIRKMVQSGLLVIAAGGGGIPVVEEDGELRGIDAVVDKDMSCSRLAVQMKADDPHGRGPGLYQFQPAGPEGAGPDDHRPGAGIHKRRTIRAGQHAAQGGGLPGVRRSPAGAGGGDHVPGERPGGPGRAERHVDPVGGDGPRRDGPVWIELVWRGPVWSGPM